MKHYKNPKRSVIVINYLSLIILVVMMRLLPDFKNEIWFIGSLAVCAVIWSVTYFAAYLQSGLWRLVHTINGQSPPELKEIAGLVAIRSYQIFTIVILAVAIAGILIQRDRISVGPLEVVAFLYFAHVLPATIIAWTRKEIPDDNSL